MKKIILLLLYSFCTFATHNRAGEITYKHLEGFTYEITITTYTKRTLADRCELEILWGDGTKDKLPRVNGPYSNYCNNMGVSVGRDIIKSIYKGKHTFGSASAYVLSVYDPNRNLGVLNIPNSVNEPFYIETILLVGGANLGTNSSPQLLNPPIDIGCENIIYKTSLAAYDPDGDSLSYKLVNCKGANAREILTTYNSAYNLDKVKVTKTGIIIWEKPNRTGLYNIAIEISEMRKDNATGKWVTLGKIVRDMQIDIKECENKPPKLEVEDKYCIEAGHTLKFDVKATDPNNDRLDLEGMSEVFLAKYNASFPKLEEKIPPLTQIFKWNTNCSYVRKNPYQITFKTIDNPPTKYASQLLSDAKNILIKVIAPAPENLVVNITKNQKFKLSWSKPNCSSNAVGYKIYRRKHLGSITRDNCTTGKPENYEFIGTLDDINQLSYIDENKGRKFNQGTKYYYVITQYFKDNAESYPSNIASGRLPNSSPIITRISVLKTHKNQGEIELKWLAPKEYDKVKYPGPYAYKVIKQDASNTSKYNEIVTLQGISKDIYIHTDINTLDSPHYYRIDFYDMSKGSMQLLGKGDISSSPFINLYPNNKKMNLELSQNVSWSFVGMEVYRKDSKSNYVKIGNANQTSYVDFPLENGKEQCYKVKTFGKYSDENIPQILENYSQQRCDIPNTNQLECTPTLSVNSDYCQTGKYLLSWDVPSKDCENIVGYQVYFSPDAKVKFKKIADIKGKENKQYILQNAYRIGRFKVQAISNYDSSDMSNIVYIKSCIDYILPNVFTPDGDGVNDVYKSTIINGIKDFKIRIYNRWGKTVYNTTDPEIKWNGIDKYTKKACVSGVYFYTCEFNRDTPEGLEYKIYKGYIHLYKDGEGSNNHRH